MVPYSLEILLTLILHLFIVLLNDDNFAHGYFQQEGATADRAHVFMKHLFDVFSEWFVLRDILQHSLPCHSSAGLYLWGAMSASVYSDNLYSLYHVKEVTSNFIQYIPHAKLVSVLINKANSVHASLQAVDITSNM